MENEHLRVLVVEEFETDFQSTCSMLEHTVHVVCDVDWADNYDTALNDVRRGLHDVYLFSNCLGDRTCLGLLEDCLAEGCKAPIILLTTRDERRMDLEAVRRGAADYLVKDQLTPPLLERAIRYAVDRHEVEQKLARMAHYDQLTGLPNRSLLGDRLHQIIALAQREGSMGALMFIDLDRFKIVNDTLGHSVGDAMLRTIGERLTRGVRDSDSVARLGGDEFVVILSSIGDVQDASKAAGRILQSIAEPVHLSNAELFTTGSIGISLFPLDGSDAESLIGYADAAMYEAKDSGGNCARFYSVEMNRDSARRLFLESGLHRALGRNEFFVEYQPMFELGSGRLVGLEALLRWRPASGETVYPAEFIPLLEQTGLIVPVGEWLLSHVFRQFRQWADEELPTGHLAVNISMRELEQVDLIDKVLHAANREGMSARDITLEVTEETVMKEVQRNIEIIRRLKNSGIRLALDDFGSGRSSLQALKYFPFDTLKIDRSFIARIGQRKGDETIARAIIAMARGLDMTVIAEGVETVAQVEFLRRFDCQQVQGYLYGRPMGTAACTAWLWKQSEG